MVYSVWNWDTLQYDYYRDDSGPKPGQPILARNKYKGDSVRPEDVLTILPGGAIRIGSGETAQGRIAVRQEEAALGQAPQGQFPILTIGIVVAVGYMLYRIAVK